MQMRIKVRKMSGNNRDVKINDHYPEFKPSFDPKELYPDAEVVSELNALTAKILNQQWTEEEAWLRRVSVPLIDEGYRLGELTFIISTDRFWRKGKPLRALLPSKDINPLVLAARRWWRKYFPYRLPNGTLYSTVSKEEVVIKK